MTRLSGIARITLLLTLVLLLSSCGRWGKREDPLETLPLESLYAEAKGSLEGGNVTRAQRYYQRLIARFPYGPYTEQSQIELAYAYYKGNKPEDATSAVNRFIRTYPAHPQIDYVYYLRGLINFDRHDGTLLRMARLDPTQREQVSLRQAFNDFNDLIQRYPNSRYAADARAKMVHLRNQMARHQLNVAVFYLERRAWVAAANRGQHIIEQFPQSIYDADALAVMSEAYARLGQDTLAGDARRVLELNYPEHPYLHGDWPAGRSWWRKLSPIGSDKRIYYGDNLRAQVPGEALDQHG
ncbi:outer membrane protein assembly factor BamD [Xanthomonadaceae bacterium JHOS43]|nr:outer membrane protein assembly factor BamD [Xanthomonadaceae bacterium JHOS43]MCX7564426.1 outer membrane protein assembly factor BamD [Xanthomonadaceae bacterium XH05]